MFYSYGGRYGSDLDGIIVWSENSDYGSDEDLGRTCTSIGLGGSLPAGGMAMV